MCVKLIEMCECVGCRAAEAERDAFERENRNCQIKLSQVNIKRGPLSLSFKV